jgi:hypothetical protein
MQKEWFDKLTSSGYGEEDIIYAHNLYPYTLDRTLLYGYTCERDTFHVYLKNNEIFVVIYDNDYSGSIPKPRNMRRVTVKSNRDYVPDKRLYPERCDYDFCKLLKEKGVHLPFTNWSEPPDDPRYPYYGFTLEDVEV